MSPSPAGAPPLWLQVRGRSGPIPTQRASCALEGADGSSESCLPAALPADLQGSSLRRPPSLQGTEPLPWMARNTCSALALPGGLPSPTAALHPGGLPESESCRLKPPSHWHPSETQSRVSPVLLRPAAASAGLGGAEATLSPQLSPSHGQPSQERPPTLRLLVLGMGMGSFF